MTKSIPSFFLSFLVLISAICFGQEGKKMRVVYKIIEYSSITTTVEKQEPPEYVPLRSTPGQSSVWQKGPDQSASVMAYNSQYESKIKILDDFSQAGEPYQSELQALDAKLKQYLKKRDITFVNDQEEVTLEVMVGSLLFDSLQGYFIDDVGYHVTRNGQELFQGVFRQKTNCSRLSTLIRGKCSGGYIGKFLAKDIHSKIKLLK